MAVRRKNSPERLTKIVLIAFAALAVITGIVMFSFARDFFKSWKSTPLEGVAVENGNDGSGGNNATSVPMNAVLQEPGGPTPEPWDGKSRVTMLIMGLDYRDWEAGEVPRTDTMILLTLDPVTRTAGMLTIPRDMWVNIPGFDYAKINTAYYLGEINHLPGGGPGLAVETVKQFLGVPINYYAQIDFSAFVKFIDEIGGVKLVVTEPITVSLIGSNKKVHIEPGEVSLPGEIALAYARNRYTEGGDFDRSARQIQVIRAVRDRILQYDSLPMLVSRAPALYSELSNGIKTNMTLEQVIKLSWLVMQLPEENIKSMVIGPEQVEMGTSSDGLSILIPIADKIRLVRDEIFTSGGPVGPAAVGEDPAKLMKDEQARVSIQNGTTTSGLAGLTAEWLRNQGVNVVDETNADQLYEVTTIFIYNAKPYTVRYLSQLLGLENPRIYNRYDPNAPYDIAVAIGEDWAANNPLQ